MELVMEKWQKVFVGIGIPAVLLVSGLAAWGWALGDLPDPMAIHFEWDRTADGSGSVVVTALMHAAFVIPSALVLVRAAYRPTPSTPMLAVIATFIGVSTSVTFISIVLANHGHEDWHDVVLGSGALVGGFGAALGTALPVALMVRRSPLERPTTGDDALPLGEDERAAWFGHMRSPGFAALGGTCAVAGAVVVVVSTVAGDAGAVLAAVTLFPVGLVLLAGSSVDVSVSEQGFVARCGLLSWPRVRFDLASIAVAESSTLYMGEWGGWGYRGSLRLMGRAAWVMRTGPGIVLHLEDGTRFAVSVDEADEATAVLNSLLARASASHASQ